MLSHSSYTEAMTQEGNLSTKDKRQLANVKATNLLNHFLGSVLMIQSECGLQYGCAESILLCKQAM